MTWKHFWALLVLAGASSAILVFQRAAMSPFTRIPCEVESPGCLTGDPAITASVIGRAFGRWDAGDWRLRDDRIFAPYPDAIATGEPHFAEAAVGYPFFRLTGSLPLAFDVSVFLACAGTVLASGFLFGTLVGPGWIALGAALLYAWGPARLNNLGVVAILWAGLVPAAVATGIRHLRQGRLRDALFFALIWLAVGLGSLYGILMGGLISGLALLLFGYGTADRRRRFANLALAGGLAAGAIAFAHRPFFHLERDFGARVDRPLMEAQSADVLSLLHLGAYAGPSAQVLGPLFPHFPSGTAALFPGLALLAVFGVLGPLARRRAGPAPRAEPEERIAFWLLLALVAFAFSLGPTIRLAGRPLGPGPWRILMELPVFRSVRGLFRWDQWYDLCLCGAGAIAAARALPALPRLRRTLGLGLAALALFDVWPRPVPAAELPVRSPFDTIYRSLPRDSIVGVYPFTRAAATLGWLEQVAHGRRVLTGFHSFAPPVTRWLWDRTRTAPAEESIALYRALGASAIEVLPAELDPDRAHAVEDLAASPERVGATRVVRGGGRLLFLVTPRTPRLVDPGSLRDLAFVEGRARVPATEGALTVRLGGDPRPVSIETPGARVHATLRTPPLTAGEFLLEVRPAPPSGAIVRDEWTGAVLGRGAR